MDRETIIGRLIGGYSVKAAVIVGALYLAHEVYATVAPIFHSISQGLGQ
jgi:hypothetical protein